MHFLSRLLLLTFCPVAAIFAADAAFPVTIRVDAAKTHGELKPIYRFFDADEPNYATMKDGRKLLRDLGDLGAPQEYFRAQPARDR